MNHEESETCREYASHKLEGKILMCTSLLEKEPSGDDISGSSCTGGKGGYFGTVRTISGMGDVSTRIYTLLSFIGLLRMYYILGYGLVTERFSYTFGVKVEYSVTNRCSLVAKVHQYLPLPPTCSTGDIYGFRLTEWLCISDIKGNPTPEQSHFPIHTLQQSIIIT